MNINERIKLLRKELGLTLEQFGNQFGVTKMTISLIENEVNNVTDQMVRSICREFDVEEEWLRYGTGQRRVPLSRSEKITDFLVDVLKDDENSFRRRYIEQLSEWSDEDWTIAEQRVMALASKKE